MMTIKETWFDIMSDPPAVTSNILIGTLITGFIIIFFGCSFLFIAFTFLKQALYPEITKREFEEYDIAEKNKFLGGYDRRNPLVNFERFTRSKYKLALLIPI